jgi:hypothetical protein
MVRFKEGRHNEKQMVYELTMSLHTLLLFLVLKMDDRNPELSPPL